MKTLLSIIDKYEAFVIDQFGVLHDGNSSYPGALTALEALRKANKPAVVLTNSGRSGGENVARLAELGFPPELFHSVVTSGDAAIRFVANEVASGRMCSESRMYVIQRAAGGLAGVKLGFDIVADPEQAQLLLIAGSQADTIPMSQYRRLLEPMVRRGVPCICTNPDIEMLTPAGKRPSAGAIAGIYTEMGGTVSYVGKPHPAIYIQVLEAIGLSDPAKICCVGDSVAHDIVGARRAGMCAALVRSGIIADLPFSKLRNLFRVEQVEPEHILDRLA